ncbi:MAG: NAD(P)H-dependent oxidoreductase [Planctomycetes bacterium]|nr:NAD(P)H-dependent oxidoreductase [Planctomycetota bacterium]
MSEPVWHDLGPVEVLARTPLQQVAVGRTKVALSFDGTSFGAIHDACNHVGGPLGKGTLQGDYIVCPWHAWKFHRQTGQGEPGFEQDRVPAFALEVRAGHLWLCETPTGKRHRQPHAKHPLDRDPVRADGPLRVLGLSTTVMDPQQPRYSTSEALLETALQHAAATGLATRTLRLRDLQFRHCEGYYSKSARACTWPCSITVMDPKDQMAEVYEALVFWADIVLVATPIRWGAASSLFFKMAERLNTVQNQITLRNRVLLTNKVGGLIVTGGQDNIQGVVGQMLTFFGELGVQFPQFPFIAHSRGWTAEDMEQNVAWVQGRAELHDGARALLERCADLAGRLLATQGPALQRGGRKASGGASGV